VTIAGILISSVKVPATPTWSEADRCGLSLATLHKPGLALKKC